MTGLNLNRYRKKPANDEDQILPLINIVFLLLIFFMIAGRLSTTDPFSLTLAASQSERQKNEHVAYIHLGPQGALFFQYKETTKAGLSGLVRNHLETHENARFRLKVDQQHKAQEVISFLGTLREMGVQKVYLATRLEAGK